jgi:zinc protease
MKYIITAVIIYSLSIVQASAVEVKEVVSEHGIKAWLVEERSLPLIAVKIAFTGSGSAYDAKGREGRANMVAAMLTEGAGDMDARSFNEAVESRAIALTSSIDEDMFHVSMETLSEHAETAFSYLGLVLTKPRFDSDAMERSRRQLLTILARQDEDPSYQLMQTWRRAAFPGHPYSRPIVGTRESVAALGKDDLRFFHNHYLTRENMVIAVVGDITPDALKRLLDEHLASLPATYKPEAALADTVMAAPAPSPQVVDFNIPQSMIMFGLPAIKRSDPDYLDAHIMNHLLGGGGALNSRLGKELREKRGLTYGIGTFIDPAPHASVWVGQFSTRNAEAGKALEVLKATLATFINDGITPEELEDAKRFITGSFVLSLDSNADIAAFLINMQIHNLGIDYLDRRNALMQAVTRENVMAMAKRLLVMDKLLVVMLGKPVLDAAGKTE